MKFIHVKNINLKNILLHTGFLLTFILFSYNISYSQIDTTAINDTIIDKDTIIFKQIISDTLFDSNQIISLIYIPKKTKKYSIKFVYDSTQLIPTSKFALKNKALAAINGGFFDMDKGGSVTYFETHDSMISKNVSKNNKWGKSSNLLNGIVILTKNDSVIIEKASNNTITNSPIMKIRL
jgi:exopolysaccharide biosynthesis protein